MIHDDLKMIDHLRKMVSDPPKVGQVQVKMIYDHKKMVHHHLKMIPDHEKLIHHRLKMIPDREKMVHHLQKTRYFQMMIISLSYIVLFIWLFQKLTFTNLSKGVYYGRNY